MRRASSSSSNFFRGLLEAVYPSKCALCGLIADDAICAVCAADFRPLPAPAIPQGDDRLLEFLLALYPYEGRPAQAVRRLKYSRATALAWEMSRQIARECEERGLLSGAWAVPVPIHWSRRCTRGFNQSELLCEGLPKELVKPRLLNRVKATRPQVGLSHDERLKNLAGAFRAHPEVAGQRIVLVDDVLTSGQTARECARALLAEGASGVGIVAFCGENR